MKAKIPIVFCLAFTTMLASGCWYIRYTGSEKQNDLLQKEKSLVLTRTMSDALDDKILLAEIRGGRISNAIDILEFSIDCSVVEMARSTNYDAASKQEISETLRLLKEYRQKYPWKIETSIGEGGDSKTASNITEEASQILERVEP